MASRPVFVAASFKEPIQEVQTSFTFFSGFSLDQKRKSIQSLHNSYLENNPNKRILEISTKSPDELGRKLSAFNLCVQVNQRILPLECVFQSSKIFENGGPYSELMYLDPVSAKKDMRLRNSGRLVSFRFDNKVFPLEPKSYFYDCLYIEAVLNSTSLVDELMCYDAFTDIEFNPKKSYNCQARSAALFVTLYKTNELNKFLNDIDFAKKFYDKENFQTSLNL